MKKIMPLMALGLMLAASTQVNSDTGKYFEVTVTNLTRGQQFTPILVASHRAGVQLFKLGSPASPELATLAEEGNTVQLTDALKGLPDVFDVTNSGALLNPGASVTVKVKTQGRFDHVSVASMLIPTNDGFFALNGVRVPRGNQIQTYTSVVYDAGSERNDELCASIPGPSFTECGGPGGGGAPVGEEEGYVHVNAGIHGIGDLKAEKRDWRNPAARITVQRVY